VTKTQSPRKTSKKLSHLPKKMQKQKVQAKKLTGKKK